MTSKNNPNYGKGQTVVQAGDSMDPIMAQIKVGVKNAVSQENFDIPLLPHVASQVLQMANNPKAGLPEIEALVKQDQVIAAKIIKTANSPFYRGMQNIVSLREAMSRMGLKALKDIVFSLSLHSKIFKIKGFEPVLAKIWDHSVACAAIAQHLAKKLSIDSDQAFIAGLLHDIGKPVLIQVVADYEENQKKLMAQKAKKEFKPFDESKWNMEKLNEILLPLVFDEYHAIVGALVASKWKLPNSICEVVRYHHEYEKTQEARKLTTVVHIANQMCHHFGYGHDVRPVEIHAQKSFAELQMNSEKVKAFVEEIPNVATSLMGNL